MSEIQDQIRLAKRQMQQRQILAMMGIPHWVQADSPTMSIADIALSESLIDNRTDESEYALDDALEVEFVGNQPSLQPFSAPVLPASEDVLEEYIDTPLQNLVTHRDSPNTDQRVEKTYSIDTLSDEPPIVKPRVNDGALQELPQYQFPADTEATIAPFDLQGGRFGNWVLLVDIQALNSDSQKLWQNIVQVLSLSCETSSFPICAGMDTAELANASLAGYIFKLGRREDIHVAVLTTLPDGLSHPNVISVPTLDEMLRDASLKRSLWEKISS